MFSLENKVAMVTGGAKGIGLGIVEALREAKYITRQTISIDG